MKMSKQVPLNALRVFEAAARLSSFTRAGEELGMTQTAVSYQIKVLEENVGEPLFLRRPRQVALTEAGDRLAPKVSEAFALLGEALATVRETAEGTLIIASTHTFASKWLAPHLGSFQLKHPAIAVRLETTSHIADFTRETMDVAIRWGDGKWPGLVCHRLMSLQFAPMLSPKLAASIGGVHEPADLLRLPIFDPGDPWWAQWFEAAGVADAKLDRLPRNQFGTQTIEAEAAIAGHGVAILNPEFYADDLALGRLYQPFELTCNDGKAYWLAYQENRRGTPRIRAFRNWIMGELPTGTIV
ncbi:LysR substrate-binding domain-containing protein [Rhizobium sp. Root482]|uniref:LysR substrate-binding domain-containing protein n=1 Tax=Rhizobium sp. Root482 TaxID=1736543 RepID=UPI0006F915DE|nr:LysR substrate-binding domain-containing protein [Rhizobium sp. Root482]KQY15307.1 LysR family transcriptional regulator [Rhizobium sp. Root482]